MVSIPARAGRTCNFVLSWSPTGKPVAPSNTPVGRNPEPGSPAKAGARVEGLWALRPDRGESNHAAPTQVSGADHDGRRSFRASSSVLDPFHPGGLGLGAPFAGIAFDHAGDLEANFAIFFASHAVSAVLIFPA